MKTGGLSMALGSFLMAVFLLLGEGLVGAGFLGARITLLAFTFILLD